jgi:3-methyl-2-oxobutanoate hydroxymethyltransferase
MSITSFPERHGSARPKVTTITIQEKKQRREPITCLTAYDYPSARLVDEAGSDMVLVGDSLAMVVLGYENTLPVTVDEMLHHTRAVRRAVRSAMVIADMPYASYHLSAEEGVRNAARFVKEAGAEAVKVEGGEKRIELIHRLRDAEIPVMGHIGLTPQSLHAMGGYKVQGKSLAAIEQLMRDATALEHAGVFSLVLEGIPREVAAMITAEVSAPTIGIGAGADCDGQVLVLHDILNLTFAQPAKFVRQYGDAATLIRDAVTRFKQDVETHAYPNEEESYHLPKETKSAFENIAARKRAMR